jgi:hypothetical protein
MDMYVDFGVNVMTMVREESSLLAAAPFGAKPRKEH